MSKKVALKDDEMVVKMDDFGWLVESFINRILRYNPYTVEGIDKRLREWWPKLEEYYQRHIQVAIEVALELDKDPPPPHADRRAMEPEQKAMWQKFLKDFRPNKSAFTVDYHCHKCKARNVKLWRGVHGCADKDGNELLCASCLAPGEIVDDKGKWQEPDYQLGGGRTMPGYRTDQVKSWLPAVPVGNTYWGYTSVPSQDVEWWVALPTYPLK